MGQILHGCARTTEAVRRTIQQSEESLTTLSKRYCLNVKTVSKWKARSFVNDAPMGPKQRRSTVLSPEEEAAIVLFRKQTLLPLDDCLYALRDTIPRLTRSSLHRCFQRHGISRLPNHDENKPKKTKFKRYPIGYFHIDIAEVRTEEGKLYLFVAIDRSSKFAYAELKEKFGKQEASDFLRRVLEVVPYKIHTILTDNGIQFTHRKVDRHAKIHIFDTVCQQNGIEHRLTQINHPWTNGQVERMNRTLKEATVKKYHYETHEQLKRHLYDFLNAYNFAKRLKAIQGLTPYEYIQKMSILQPNPFAILTNHLTAGLNN